MGFEVVQAFALLTIASQRFRASLYCIGVKRGIASCSLRNSGSGPPNFSLASRSACRHSDAGVDHGDDPPRAAFQ